MFTALLQINLEYEYYPPKVLMHVTTDQISMNFFHSDNAELFSLPAHNINTPNRITF